MNKTSIAAGAIFAACLGVFASSDAEAGTRLHSNYFTYEPEYQTYYPGPLYVPRPRYFYYHDYDPDPPYAYDYEPDYYEPQVQPRRYQRPSKPPYATRKLQQQKALSYEEPSLGETPPEAAKKPAPTKKKAAGISCDKAAKIVADYGFTSVKPANCKGLVYSFKGSRDGKSYTIKLSAKSGELTEVKKL
jgi:hypothetical protein